MSDLSEISIRLGTELLEAFGAARAHEIQNAKTELRQSLARLSRVRPLVGTVRFCLCLGSLYTGVCTFVSPNYTRV